MTTADIGVSAKRSASDISDMSVANEKATAARAVLLRALYARLSVLTAACPQSEYVQDTASCSVDAVRAARVSLHARSGVAVFLDAVDDATLREARRRTGQCMTTMFARTASDDAPLFDDATATALRRGDLFAANALRNARGGFGNASFGYLGLQFTAPAQDVVAQVGGESVKLVALPLHHDVLMWLMCGAGDRGDAPRRTALLLAMSTDPRSAMLSWDSVKVAGGPRPRGMTAQARTAEHIDEYGARHGNDTGRIQANITDDEDATKLCFVPHTNDAEVRRLIAALLGKPDFFAQHGFKALSGGGADTADLLAVLDQFAFAAPRRALVCWASGVVHYEANAAAAPRAGELLLRVLSRACDRRDRRLRFVVGTHRPTLARDELERLAVIARLGAVPDYTRDANKRCAPHVYKNIMNGKSTQFLKARVRGEAEMTALRACVDAAADPQRRAAELQSLTPLYRHLYGITQPLKALGFSDADSSLLCSIATETL
jgi:hypothetical protein